MRLVRQLVTAVAGAAAATAFLVYCGGTPVGSADAGGVACDCPAAVVKSGTRLSAITLRASDGARQFVGWWDTELGVECAFNAHPENQYGNRCVPVGGGTDGIHFTDPACSVPVFGRESADTTTKYCGTPEGLRPLGATVAKIYKRDSGNACVQADDPFTQRPWTFFACDGAVVAADAFVSIERGHD